MADRLNTFSNSYFTYVTFWRPSVSLGTTNLQSSTKTDKLEVRHKWHIMPIAVCVIITVTLVIGIYNAITYQKISTTVFMNTTSDIITTTTTATSRAAVVASTTDYGTTTSTTATTAISTFAVDTTSAVVSTEDITTKRPPICPSMLLFGNEAGDMNSSSAVTKQFNYTLWDMKPDEGELTIFATAGAIKLTCETYDELEVRMVHGIPISAQWSVYYRFVSSKDEQDAIACLVNNSQSCKAYVITWVKNGTTEASQCIIASFGESATYIIRIYSENLPESDNKSPVVIHFGSATYGDYYYFAQAKIQDVAGQRQIFDVSKALGEGQNLTVREEGKNCDVFVC